jgi:hypothetical protein
MCSGKVALPLSEGKNLSIGGKEVELEYSIPRGEFLTGACFGHKLTSTTQNNSISMPTTKFNAPSLKSIQGHGSGPSNPHPENDQIPTLGPSDITNYSLHWTANWYAYIINSQNL